MSMLRSFEMHQPASLAEASQILAHYGEDGGIYAGGTELLLAMKHRALGYRHLVDLKVIPGLNSIEARDGALEIGATCTHRALERSSLLLERQPALAELESRVANVRVRATGTLGGNLCFAEPHSDPATLLLVLEAKLKLQGPAGTREVSIEQFISGAYANALLPGELLAKIIVPALRPDQRTAYVKFQVQERPTLGLGLWLQTPDHGRTFTAARVAVGCVCPFPRRFSAAEQLLSGDRARVEALLPEAADALAGAADLIDDHEGSVDYKRNLIRVFLRRAFHRALNYPETS